MLHIIPKHTHTHTRHIQKREKVTYFKNRKAGRLAHSLSLMSTFMYLVISDVTLAKIAPNGLTHTHNMLSCCYLCCMYFSE